MAPAALRTILRSARCAWLLAFVLWLPAAQLAAAAHALLHLQAAMSGDRDPPAHLPAPCDLCVVAASIGGAAPPAHAGLSLPPAAPHALPQHAGATDPATAFLASYRSRAPPFLPA